MRYEDWTYREAEVRLEEHAELRAALGLARAPDHTTLHRFLRRLDDGALQQALVESVRRLPPPPRGGTTVAVDATGLAPGAVSTYFVNRVRDRVNGLPWRPWLKWLVAVDVPRRAVLAQLAKPGPLNDSATLRPLVDAAARVAPVRLVLADAEFDSERNHQHVRTVLGAHSVIPAKRARATRRSWRSWRSTARTWCWRPRRWPGSRQSIGSSSGRRRARRPPARPHRGRALPLGRPPPRASCGTRAAGRLTYPLAADRGWLRDQRTASRITSAGQR